MEHTPGIWMIAKNGMDDKYKYTILSNATKAICDVYRHNWPKKKPAKDLGAEANANLIAAAPELLEALKLALADPEKLKLCSTAYSIAKNHRVTPDVQKKADYYDVFIKALTKAEGK